MTPAPEILRNWAAVTVTSAVELVLNVVILAYSLGRLSERVEVLWLAVFNHLGQDAQTARAEWRRRKRRGKHDA